MTALSFLIIIGAGLAAVLVLRWASFSRHRRQTRDEMREMMHTIRIHPTLDHIGKVQAACTSCRIPPAEVGTSYLELCTLEREAHRLEAQAELRRMREDKDGTYITAKSLGVVLDALRAADREGDWAAIGTSWEELRMLHRNTLLTLARRIACDLSSERSCAVRKRICAKVEELLILAHADVSDLQEGFDLHKWEAFKKA